MYIFSHYEGTDDDLLAVYKCPSASDLEDEPVFEIPGPRDRLGTIIYKGDVISAGRTPASLRPGTTGTVTSITSSEGHDGAQVWSIGVQPHDGSAHFHTAAPGIYEVGR